MADPIVSLDLAACRAWIAGVAVAVQPRPGGGLVFGQRIIRPLRFGERWRLLDAAVNAGNRIGATVLACATEVASTPETDTIAEVLALHLAGARPERSTPGFTAQLATLTAAGWEPPAVFDTDADLIDLLTSEVPGGTADGWTSIVLTAADGGAGSAAEALRVLEGELLSRLLPTAADAPTNPEVLNEFRLAADVATESVVPVDLRRPAADPVPAGVAAPACAPVKDTDAAPPATAVPVDIEAQNRLGAKRPGVPGPGATPAPGPAVSPAFPVPIRATRSAGWHAASSPLPPVDAPDVDHRADPHPVPPWPADQGSHAWAQRPAYRAYVPAATEATVVRDERSASRAQRLAAPVAADIDPFDTANLVAVLLNEESDLRGLLP
ncbi:hypothetical protein AWB98_19170 [Mycolicibacterium conceptionense]|uniref:Uncharacterized protein n=1 Tax=Mycolicibacterium conceptionense TaxID=451644 RepID=A0ABX3V4W3_9MYCO|nr:hypothetical protein [Mycolicibacterium conceptionense]ORV25017.1 hypothetical protein AWB98_19170 [Mycolicibacterium conceptionense]